MPEPMSADPAGVTDPSAPFPAGAELTPVATGLAMKYRHPVLVWLLWPTITFGLYHFVWYYKIHKEMAEFDRRRAVPTVGPMLVLLFLSWTVVAPMVSYYNAGARIRAAQRAAGLRPTCSPGIGCVLMLVMGLGVLYYQIELDKITDVYQVSPGSQISLFE
jgi:hypothetical protein